MDNILNVYWKKLLVGIIVKEKNIWQFTYSGDWLKNKKAFSISISMPLKDRAFDHNTTYSFFCNLLPEADIRRKILLRLGFSQENDFALLDAIGGECSGALIIVSRGAKIEDNGEYLPLNNDLLKDMLKHQSDRTLLHGIDELRLSLAGAQDKLPIYIDDMENIFLPTGIHASTHILKPNIKDFEDSVLNEYFCMKLAKRIGLNVANVSIFKLDEIPLLLVERYDRRKDCNSVIRLHQEDFCQALSYSYNQKYESEGGPSLKACFNLIDKFTTHTILEKRKFLEWVVFNFFVGNADAHAKNISFLYEDNNIVLAPFYDIMNTLVYPGISKKMAMRIGRENRFGWILEKNWQRLADDIQVKERVIKDTLERLADHLLDESEKLIKEMAEQGYAIKLLESIAANIKLRVDIQPLCRNRISTAKTPLCP